MKHLHDLEVQFAGFKTGKAMCGQRVKTSDFATDADADCPHCRKEAEARHAQALQMVESFEKFGMTDNTRKMREELAKGVNYRNVRIGL